MSENLHDLQFDIILYIIDIGNILNSVCMFIITTLGNNYNFAMVCSFPGV